MHYQVGWERILMGIQTGANNLLVTDQEDIRVCKCASGGNGTGNHRMGRVIAPHGIDGNGDA